MNKIAYFTAGSIGAGHLVRGLAIEKGLRRAGYRGQYEMYGPGIPFVIDAPPNHTTIEINSSQLRDPTRAKLSEVALILQAYDPDLVIIDMFWVPMIHIMDDLRAECWLLLHKCAPRWLKGPSFARFDPSRYDRVLATEPLNHPLLPEEIEPIVIFDPDEMEPPGALRQRIDVDDDTHLTVAMHAGMAGEIDTFEAPPSGEIFRSDMHTDGDVIFPIAKWLGDADAILSGAGYNVFWEAKWLGYYDRCHLKAFERPIDDQAWRLETLGDYEMKENGADQLASMILGTSG